MDRIGDIIHRRAVRSHPGGNLPRRWVLFKLDADKFKEAILAAAGQEEQPGIRDQCLEREAERLVSIVDVGWHAAMPKSRPRPCRAVYWWSEAFVSLRQNCVQAGRRYTAIKRSGGDAAEAMEKLRATRRTFRASTVKAKAAAWEKLLATL